MSDEKSSNLAKEHALAREEQNDVIACWVYF